MATFLSQLEWRDAVKMFDPNDKVSDADLHKVTEAIRLAPTSFGLQPFYVRVVKDAATNEKLRAVGWNQPQFTTATATLVFVARNDVLQRIEESMQARSGGNSDVRAKLADFEGMMKGFAQSLTPEQALTWAQKQVYIALGFAMAACAELGIGSCPMEGFQPDEFNKILGLPEGHRATVVLAVGRPAKGAAPYPKFRFSEKDIVR